MPSSPHPRPSRGHSAGFLTFEAVVTYPFHPLVGRTVLVVGDHEHDGIRYFLIRQPHGGSYQVPDWMFTPDASTPAVVTVPRLPIGQLVLLRALVDRLIACPSKNRYPGGISHEAAASRADESVCRTASTAGVVQRRAPGSRGAPAHIADASIDRVGRQSIRRRRDRSRQ